MPYIIGTDEAGYGPNLGPLVVAATVWEVPDEPVGIDLYDRLTHGVARCGEDPHPSQDRRAKVVIGDSKQVYHPGEGVAGLERGVLAVLKSIRQNIGLWSEAWRTLAEDFVAQRDEAPWYDTFDRPLPVDLAQGELDVAADVLATTFRASGVRFLGAACRPVFPREFNRRAECDNKATLLTEISLELAARMMSRLNQGPAWLIFDKHGGRNFYAAAVQHAFPDGFVRVICESRAKSVYRFSQAGRAVEAHFCAGGEEHLPAALASMTAKYLRELAMLAFNAWWSDKVPGLRPTAGYPGDSRRFMKDIARTQRRLKISDAVMWRKR